ncbi:MAG: endonuclease domain-containing protein, partial [Acidimicrobiales bacterium]
EDRPLVVDHDHRTGAVRGLLCGPCNRAIGLLRDSPVVCRLAAEYLRGSVRGANCTGC